MIKSAGLAAIPNASAGIGKIMADRGAMLRPERAGKASKQMMDQWINNFEKNNGARIGVKGRTANAQRRTHIFNLSNADTAGAGWSPNPVTEKVAYDYAGFVTRYLQKDIVDAGKLRGLGKKLQDAASNNFKTSESMSAEGPAVNIKRYQETGKVPSYEEFKSSNGKADLYKKMYHDKSKGWVKIHQAVGPI